jgi:pimeloyl-ACP methyl ester carboxylesterase
MASSFGAHLAVHLARQAPELVKEIVLLAPTFNPERPRCAWRAARSACTPTTNMRASWPWRWRCMKTIRAVRAFGMCSARCRCCRM